MPKLNVDSIRRAAGDATMVAGLAASAWGFYRLVGPHWTALAAGLVVAALGFAIGRR